MKYKESFISIIRRTLLSMSFPVVCYKVTPSGNDYTLICDDIYFSQVGCYLNILGKDYTIKEIDAENETLVVTDESGVNPISGPCTFNMYPVYFFHGTPKEVNTEIVQETSAWKKTPMIWLLETYREKFYDNPEDPHERDVDARIFFLGQSDFGKLTGEIYTDLINPMTRLSECFRQAIEDDFTTYSEFEQTHETVNYTKFAVYVNGPEGSPKKQLFADELSGIEMPVMLKILKRGSCCPPAPNTIYLGNEDGSLRIGDESGIPLIYQQ